MWKSPTHPIQKLKNLRNCTQQKISPKSPPVTPGQLHKMAPRNPTLPYKTLKNERYMESLLKIKLVKRGKKRTKTQYHPQIGHGFQHAPTATALHSRVKRTLFFSLTLFKKVF